MKLLSSIIAVFFLTFSAQAQTSASWLEETMYSSGKIYVVVGVVVLILIGIFGYLVWIDKRLRKMEEENTHQD